MEKLLNTMKEAFGGRKKILDIGIGTGRFAQYFINSGSYVVGVDISLSMMAKAREKGVKVLVRADAHRLPFRDGSFDATVMIHLLHLVYDWKQVVREVGRVTGRIVVSEVGEAEGFRPRQEYLRLRKEMGHPLNRLNDAEHGLRRIVPPKLLARIGDYESDVEADDSITQLEREGFAISWDLPKEIHRAIIDRLRSDYGGKRFRRRDVIEVAGWDPEQLRTLNM
ncbi:MAG TPA: class I SAM-dependent methyltransferase [Candidatus Bathyarchaeia archaeon]|nr:class I SAM-dependent methyltransferase [Candidatus Bathyarchaeia archaeon]